MSSQPRSQPYIQASNVSHSFDSPGGKRIVVGPFNLELRQGEFLSLLGPRGSGKSTLLRIIAGLIPPATGEVKVSGRKIDSPMSDLGFVFEDPLLICWRSVMQNVLLQAELRGLDCRASEERARRLLAAMELSCLEDRKVQELSPDLAARISICRALLHNPSLLLMDDPLRRVDPLSREQTITCVQRLWMGMRLTVIFGTSDITQAMQLSDRIAIMSAHPGQIAQILTVDLPRPRRMDKTMMPLMAEYGNRIRTAFRAQGILP